MPNQTQNVEVQLPSLHGAPEGVSTGVRRALEFRERSSVAVWFNGERVLGEIVDPVAAGTAPGGTIGGDFTGEVRKTSKRLYRTDEVATPAEAAPPRGGTLQLRVRLPEPVSPKGEPLFATGVLYGSDLVILRDAGDGGVTLAFEHSGAPSLISPTLRLSSRSEHVIEITLPSCRAGDDFGAAARGDVVLGVNGEEVLREVSDGHNFSAGSERIGHNPFGGGSERSFRGWIVEARWVDGR